MPERAGAGLSGVNEMNFSRHRVGGLATAPEMCVFCVKDFHWEKKENTERGREKNVRGCWLVYRLCIDFSLSDTLIFHMAQSALSLPAFCLHLNFVPHRHYQRLLKTVFALPPFFTMKRPLFVREPLSNCSADLK